MEFILLCLVIGIVFWVRSVDSKINKLRWDVDRMVKRLEKAQVTTQAKPIARNKASTPPVETADSPAPADAPTLTPSPTPAPALARSAAPLEQEKVKEEQKKEETEQKNPSTPLTQLPAKKKEEKEELDTSFERLLLGNLFNKIGAIALIIGAAIFIKMISPYMNFSPVMRVFSVFVLGVVLMGISVKIHQKKLLAYAEVLMGTGLAILFVAAYGGAAYYEIIPPQGALAVGCGITLLSYVVSRYYKTFSTMLIGLIGGYLSIFILDVYTTVSFLFSYLIFLNIVSLVFTLTNRSKVVLNYANIILTMIIASVAPLALVGEVHYLHPLLLWAAYALYDFLSVRRDYSLIDRGLSVVNFCVLLLFAAQIFGLDDSKRMGLILAGTALVYGVMGFYYQRVRAAMGQLYFSGGILAALFATYFIEQETVRVIAWALEGLVLAGLCKLTAREFLAKWSVIALLASLSIALVLMPRVEVQLLNERTLQLLVPALCALSASLLIKQLRAGLAHLLQFLALCFAYIFVVLEMGILLDSSDNADQFNNIAFCYVILAWSFVLCAYRLYVSTGFVLFRIASYLVYAVAILLTLLSVIVLEYSIILLHLKSLAVAVAVGTNLLMARWHKMDGKMAWLPHAFVWMGVSLGFFFLAMELHQQLAQRCEGYDVTEAVYSNSMMTLLYALCVYRLCLWRKHQLFAYTSYVTLVAVSVLLVVTCFDPAEYSPILNLRCGALVGAIGASLLVARWSRVAQFSLLPVLLGLALISSEVYWGTDGNQVLLTLSWVLYAAALLGGGIFHDQRVIKYVGIWMMMLSLVKFVFADLSGANMVYRTIAFLSFGAILMGLSYYYSKRAK